MGGIGLNQIYKYQRQKGDHLPRHIHSKAGTIALRVCHLCQNQTYVFHWILVNRPDCNSVRFAVLSHRIFAILGVTSRPPLPMAAGAAKLVKPATWRQNERQRATSLSHRAFSRFYDKDINFYDTNNMTNTSLLDFVVKLHSILCTRGVVGPIPNFTAQEWPQQKPHTGFSQINIYFD